MANFKDKFVFFMNKFTILRYSLTHHIEEESLAIPGSTMDEFNRACSLGDKVYMRLWKTITAADIAVSMYCTTQTPPSPPKRCIGK